MHCPACGAENRDTARFCGECSAALVRSIACPACSAGNPPGRRFCDSCGASLAAPAAAADSEPRRSDDAVARKTVTIVFADLSGSTTLHERMDAEAARALMDRYYAALQDVVEANGGRVVKLLGDGVMSAFGVPRVGEDDALRAVRAGVAMQEAVRKLSGSDAAGTVPLALRVGINTGEVVVHEDSTDVIGDPVNVAARLEQEAREGQVLIGEATSRLVGAFVTLVPHGSLSLKGRSEKVAAWRVVSLDPPAAAATTAFFGRDDELAWLLALFDDTVAARRARLGVILGSPGLGKSRLLTELQRRIGQRATVMTAHCDAAAGATFAPLADALRRYLHLDDASANQSVDAAIRSIVSGDDAARVGAGIAAMIAATPAPPEETFFVVRRLLGAIAAGKPAVLVIDDVQWAAPLLLDLTEHLAQWTSGVPLLILLAARPELRDLRSSMVTPGGVVSDVITLSGLDAAAAMHLAANVIGADVLPAAVAGRVLATSEGNPLFVGELVRMLVHDGALRREGDRWTAGAELASVEMPPTIQALLAARIERLKPEERAVLERAAVVGRQFSRAAVAHLLPRDAAGLDARIEALRRSELIEPETGWFLGEPLLRFHHVLIRDAAYRRVLKGTRAEMHARLADWIAARAGDSFEHEETLGWHLEQAHQNLRDLGPVDAAGRALGNRAALHLAAAGRRALARDDIQVAANLLGRAMDCLDAADASRADLALDWCEALLAAGDVSAAATAIDELGRFRRGSARFAVWETCFRGQLAVLTDPQSLETTVGAVADAALSAASAKDSAAEAKAHQVHAQALARLGKIGECELALDRALAAAREAQDSRRANAVLAGAPQAALWGPSPVTRASGRCLDVVRVLRITQGAPAVEAVALRCQAVLEALRGRSEAARRILESSRHLVEELGITQRLLEADVAAGQIELFEGNATAAEPLLRSACQGLRERGLRIDAAQAAALLARALLVLGRDAEAEALSHESEELAGDDLRANVAWRGVRAEALARRGEHAAAIELAQSAVDIASTTDALLDHADARRALGAALRAAGRAAEAESEETRARELWEAKGATILLPAFQPELRAEQQDNSNGRAGAARAQGRGRERAAGPAQPATAEPARDRQARTARKGAGANDSAERSKAADALDAARTAVAAAHRRSEPPLRSQGGAALEVPPNAAWKAFLDTPGDRTSASLLATAGESLALARIDRRPGAEPSSWLEIIEIDRDGLVVATTTFAVDDRRGAAREMLERFVGRRAAKWRMHPSVEFARAMIDHDLDRLGKAIPPDFVFDDHRRTGAGRIEGGENYLSYVAASFELSPDALMERAYVVRSDMWGGVNVGRMIGTFAEGGHFETVYVSVGINDGPRFVRTELYEMDDLDLALARFEALRPKMAPAAADPLRIPPNRAWKAQQRAIAAYAAGDFDAIVSACGPGFSFDDRRPGVNISGNAARLHGDLSFLAEQQCRITGELVATAGEDLALVRLQVRGGEQWPFEVPILNVTQVDGNGLVASTVNLAGSERRGAARELLLRYLAGHRAGQESPVLVDSVLALLNRDLGRVRAMLSDDFVLIDHRRAGAGQLDGPDAYMAWLDTLYEQSPDVLIENLYIVTGDEHGGVNVPRVSGTLPEGGEFENVFVRIVLQRDGMFVHGELFELEDMDKAKARYAELGADRG